MREKHSHLAAPLKELLDRLLHEKRLPIERGVINRSEISKILGVPYGAVAHNPKTRAVFEEFNQKLREEGYSASKWDTFPSQLREWLTQHFAARTYRVSSGRLCRSWIRSELSLPNSVTTRYPEVRAVIEEFDQRLQGDAPESSRYPTLLEDLRRVLAANDPPVFKGRLNRTEIARQLGVQVSAFKLVPTCETLLGELDNEIRKGRVTAPWCEEHQRSYDFGEFVPHLGRRFTISLATAFVESAQKYAAGSAKGQYLALLELLRWLISSPYAAVLAPLREGSNVDEKQFRIAVHAWAEARKVGEGKPQSISVRLKYLSSVLMGLDGMLPKVGGLRGPRRAARKSEPKRTLAQASSQSLNRIADDVEVYCSSRDIEFERDEMLGFLRELASEADVREVRTEGLPEAIRRLNKKRLDRVRSIAKTQFAQAIAKLEEGKALIAACTTSSSEIEILVNDALAGRITKAEVINFFTEQSGGLAAFLVHVQSRFDGLVPKATRANWSEYRNFYSRIVSKLGGIDAVDALLHLSSDGVAAACLLFLCDTGANVAVGCGLRVDCMRSSEIAGHKEVIGYKRRAQIGSNATNNAKAKTISYDLPVSDASGEPTTVRALERVVTDVSNLRRGLAGNESEKLFIVRVQDKPKVLTDHLLLARLRLFVENDDVVPHDIRTDMIRPSYLLDAALATSGRTRDVAAIARHSSIAVTEASYTNRWPVRLLREDKARAFHKDLQNALIHGIEGAAKRLGIKEVDASDVVATGLGTLCVSPRAGIQPGTTPGEECDRLDGCPNCIAHAVVAEPELIADLLLWSESLEEASKEWEAERPERWERWVIWWAFCDATIEFMQSGHMARVLAKAERIARDRKLQPRFQLPRPY